MKKKIDRTFDELEENDFRCFYCDCTRDDIVVIKGDGEMIIGLDLIGYYCPKCDTDYYFSNIRYRLDIS